MGVDRRQSTKMPATNQQAPMTPRTSLWKDAIRRPWKREPATPGHRAELCAAIGRCHPRTLLESVVLQGGVHHTQIVFAVSNGRPLKRSCIDVSLTWYRAQRGGEFHVVPFANDDWYQPTAEDIGATLLLHMRASSSDGDVVVNCAEFGPIVEDPTIRSHVENIIESRTAFFTNLHIAPSNHHEIAKDDTWSLLIDDKRVRISCESSLIPPFEALYSSELQIAMAPQHPNGFLLAMGHDTRVPTPLHLKVDSNRTRDIIYLVFTAFKAQALRCQAHSDAVSTGQSPLLALRTVVSPTKEVYALPWHQKSVSVRPRKPTVLTPSGSSDDDESLRDDDDDDENYADDDDDYLCSALLQDVDALLLGHSGLKVVAEPLDDDVARLKARIEELEMQLAHGLQQDHGARQ
ncbi:hypothetical protein SPRG_04722 [Saprolegnia parasitica CBS 223.65]|uniref:Uncharacterized protein n=1 Tax=Saprolegnia parasitica (strain CBS 223.65) TaxID=695850 RepID=A0A067CWC5_SAPPC|nr:hypothetical protein SPRG_04722 [Saprolegnia parasitica CBS 223.65]KDO30821.1 hypothetical protein SPRG_04722 [Saprolegnia parasitica CBS 223.65]|eukprot:XP_012198518.1 hypothetical protein SPRG_04722 [Saprolegnia parasitica CBS 223.65]